MEQIKTQHTSNILHRITLAWAISECALGGFLHAIQSPFTGLLVGGLSVMFISLLAYHAENPKAAILQALVFVLGVKMAVSPHSPLGAYFAVAMQAFAGILFFSIIPRFSIAALFTGVLTVILSSVQKVLILTILFGVGFWNAIDEFTQGIVSNMSFLSLDVDFSLSEWMIGIYIGVYTLGGIFIGWLAGRIPTIFERNAKEFDVIIEAFDAQKNNSVNQVKTKKSWKIWPLILVFVLLGITLQWMLFSAESAFNQLLRTAGVLLAWLLILRPLFKWILRKTLNKHQQSLESELEQVQMRIPVLVEFAKYAWKGRKFSGSHPLLGFISIYVYYAVYKL